MAAFCLLSEHLLKSILLDNMQDASTLDPTAGFAGACLMLARCSATLDGSACVSFQCYFFGGVIYCYLVILCT